MLKKYSILPLFTVILLAGCARLDQAVPSIASETSLLPTYTSTPDIEPSTIFTWTPPSTGTATMVPTPTWTPLPTLSTQQVDAELKKLIETNGGCSLPCWWGISPNKTPWSEALHLLNPLQVDIKQGSSQSYYKNGKQHVGTNFSVYFMVPDTSKQGRIIFSVQDDIVTGISVLPPVVEYKYQLHELLALLGSPKQVLVNAQSTSPVNELPPTVLTLDYSDIGVWASYGFIPSVDGESLVICPKSVKEPKSAYEYENLGGSLELFDPKYENDRMPSIQEYAEMVGGFTPRKLEEVSDMTTESFYNTFIEPGPKTCLVTPADLWP